MSREKHLTVEELADRMGVSKNTVYIWNTKGTGPKRLPVGRHVRYRLADVVAWENARVTGGSADS